LGGAIHQPEDYNNESQHSRLTAIIRYQTPYADHDGNPLQIYFCLGNGMLGYVFDNFINSLAGTFSSVNPSQLKAALKPGGLEKVWPKLEGTIAENLQKQPMGVDPVPLTKGDKKQLLQYLQSAHPWIIYSRMPK
jgi:hypothetical protein